jgi:predicted glycosyltransferase involved in capsule biosynthesis
MNSSTGFGDSNCGHVTHYQQQPAQYGQQFQQNIQQYSAAFRYKSEMLAVSFKLQVDHTKGEKSLKLLIGIKWHMKSCSHPFKHLQLNGG